MQPAQPRGRRASAKSQLFRGVPPEVVKNDVHRNGIRVEGIDAGREQQIALEPANATVPPPADAVRKKPKDVAQQMRPGNTRYLAPLHTVRSGFRGIPK